MFLGDSGTELEVGNLRSGRRFRLGKIRRTMTKRGSYSMTGGEDQELTSCFSEGYCDEEEEYQPISKSEEEEEEEEALDLEYEYDTPTTPCTSLEVTSKTYLPVGLLIKLTVAVRIEYKEFPLFEQFLEHLSWLGMILNY